jgi:hypothetical protein
MRALLRFALCVLALYGALLVVIAAFPITIFAVSALSPMAARALDPVWSHAERLHMLWREAVHPLPPLATGLPGDTRAASTAFNEAVQQRFPPGSNETDLIAELQKENFTQPSSDPRSGKRYASFTRRAGLVMEERVTVVWKTDAEGRITEIAGSHGLTGP